MLKLQLRRHDAPSYRTVAIEFPAPEPDLQENMKELGIGITTEKLCLVDAVQNDHRGLQALAGTLVNADEVQYLAKRMDSFDKNELNTFYAAAEHEKLTEVKDLITRTLMTAILIPLKSWSESCMNSGASATAAISTK